VKDIRQQKERIKQRKSMLIYGSKDMGKKLFDRENRLKNIKFKLTANKRSNSENGAKTSTSCKDRMKWSAKSPFLNFWDGFMLIVIVYSCFTSMYFAAIEFDIC